MSRRENEREEIDVAQEAAEEDSHPSEEAPEIDQAQDLTKHEAELEEDAQELAGDDPVTTAT